MVCRSPKKVKIQLNPDQHIPPSQYAPEHMITPSKYAPEHMITPSKIRGGAGQSGGGGDADARGTGPGAAQSDGAAQAPGARSFGDVVLRANMVNKLLPEGGCISNPAQVTEPSTTLPIIVRWFRI